MKTQGALGQKRCAEKRARYIVPLLGNGAEGRDMAGTNGLGGRNGQVVQEIESGRGDGLGAEEDADLGDVAGLVDDEVPEEAVHGVALAGAVVDGDDALQLGGGDGGKIGESGLLDEAPVVEESGERDRSVDGTAFGVLEGGSGLPDRLNTEDFFLEPEVFRDGDVEEEVLDAVEAITVEQVAGENFVGDTGEGGPEIAAGANEIIVEFGNVHA
jgi:hypothetical protein